MTSEQESFWDEVKKIQDLVVNVTLSKISKYDDAEKLLNDVTYETIYGIMELLDGHKNINLRGDVINKITGCTGAFITERNVLKIICENNSEMCIDINEGKCII